MPSFIVVYPHFDTAVLALERVPNKVREIQFENFPSAWFNEFSPRLINFFLLISGSRICALLVANPNHSCSEVPQTLRDH